MIDFLEIVFILTVVLVIGFCMYRLGRADGYLDGQMDCVERLQQPTFGAEWARRERAAGRIPLD